MYSDQRGTPIYRSTLEYQIKTRKRIHGTTCKITQFPLRLAWAVTGHKVQGLTIKRGSDVVAHGYKKMPNALYYVILSRAQAMENVFLKNFLPEKLKADPSALEEDCKLQERCIIPSYKDMHFQFFVVNVRSLSKHIIDVFNGHVCSEIRSYLSGGNMD